MSCCMYDFPQTLRNQMLCLTPHDLVIFPSVIQIHPPSQDETWLLNPVRTNLGISMDLNMRDSYIFFLHINTFEQESLQEKNPICQLPRQNV